MQQRAVRQLIEERGQGTQERYDREQFEHQRATPDASLRRGIGARARRIRADVQSADDRGGAGQHQQLHGDAETRRFACLDQQQRHEAGQVKHDAHQARPYTRVAFRGQDRQRESVGSDCGSLLRHCLPLIAGDFSLIRNPNTASRLEKIRKFANSGLAQVRGVIHTAELRPAALAPRRKKGRALQAGILRARPAPRSPHR